MERTRYVDRIRVLEDRFRRAVARRFTHHGDARFIDTREIAVDRTAASYPQIAWTRTPQECCFYKVVVKLRIVLQHDPHPRAARLYIALPEFVIVPEDTWIYCDTTALYTHVDGHPPRLQRTFLLATSARSAFFQGQKCSSVAYQSAREALVREASTLIATSQGGTPMAKSKRLLSALKMKIPHHIESLMISPKRLATFDVRGLHRFCGTYGVVFNWIRIKSVEPFPTGIL